MIKDHAFHQNTTICSQSTVGDARNPACKRCRLVRHIFIQHFPPGFYFVKMAPHCIRNTDSRLHLQKMLSGFKSHFWFKTPRPDEIGGEVLSHEILFRECIKEGHEGLPVTHYDFLPSDWQARFMDRRNIRRTLKHCGKLRKITSLTDYVHTKAQKVFLLLILINKLDCIRHFHHHHFEDGHLPVTFHENWELKNPSPENFSKCFSRWNSSVKELFQSKQWVFLAPLFSQGSFFYELEPKQPLPFKALADTSLGSGHFGSVYKIEIPKSHLEEQNAAGYLEVALKCLGMPSGTEKDKYFKRETETLEKMKGLNHPHLIRAHSAYHRGADMGFVFPYANGGSLARFWKHNNPTSGTEVVSWALAQMKGLAEGLEQLHHKNTRHGDIKPQNILIFEDSESKIKTLVIADVGISKYHAFYTSQRNNSTTAKYGSRRYWAPEVEENRLDEGEARKRPRSRRYDVWSFGCVLLEFIFWLHSGAEGLENFIAASSVNQQEACFWEGESLRPVITNSIKQLEKLLSPKNPECTALKDILNLVQNDLLTRVDVRADSATVSGRIRSIQSQFSLSSGDLTQFPPEFVPRIMDGANETEPDATILSRNVQSTTRMFNSTWTIEKKNQQARDILRKLHWASLLCTVPSVICDICKTIDPKAAEILINRSPEQLREGSDLCNLCNLLSQSLSKRNITSWASLRLARDQSTLRVSQNGPPLLSTYSDLGSDYAPVGLPDLPKVGSPQQFALLRAWIQICDGTHDCCTGIQAPMPSRVIDVGEGDTPCLQLINPPANMKAKYVALSHCWGQATQQPTHPMEVKEDLDRLTTKENVAALMKGITLSRLPRTFQDAVRTTRSLGLRYLWIDSLCIIQDDEEDWRRESKRMGDVYSSAYVTIAACSSRSSSDGFLVDRPSRNCATIVGSDGPIYLAEAVDDFERDVEKSVLNTRGWVLQERALSRRTIHFTSTQVYWECGDGIQCETLAQLRSPPLTLFLGDSNFPAMGLKYYKNQRIEFIQSLYQAYSARKLTKQTDRPVAISGLQRRIGDTFQSKVAHGIIYKYFQRSILWRAREAYGMSRIIFASNSVMPSWSWMAYTGEITYMKIPFGKVDWTNDLQNPYENYYEDLGEEEHPSVSRLFASARSLEIEGSDLFSRITLDMDVRSDFDKDRWKCIRLGKDKGDTGINYVLLIRPVNTDDDVYERIGAGVLLDSHFSRPGQPVWLE
ncbi:hypothetical protein F4859DRAFT_487482 [Xylaria cf. heliscus]|nr:hypothetical protein F4859DRAFT_487482 [Xylaria cf. heliscus]